MEAKHRTTTTNLAYVTFSAEGWVGVCGGETLALQVSSACPRTGSGRSSRLLLKPAEPRDATTGRGLTVAAASRLPPLASASCRRTGALIGFVGTSQILKLWAEGQTSCRRCHVFVASPLTHAFRRSHRRR